MVSNAVKYAVESNIIKGHISSAGSSAKVTVSNEGAGIPADRLLYLFDRFYKAEPDGLQYSGMGLGLYISSEIVKHHGGDIGVENILGKGSTFWFTLPLNKCGHMNVKEYPFYIKATVILIGLFYLVSILNLLSGILVPFSFAVLFAILLNPLYNRLLGWKFPRPLALLR